jgi:putative intracellular protease/amidase
MRTNFKVVAAIVAGAGLSLAAPASSAEPKAATTPARKPAQLDLTPESFARLHALIRPHDDEWRHLRVQWLTDVVAVRKKAAAEDKPIVICYTGGAGYNEPLGTC